MWEAGGEDGDPAASPEPQLACRQGRNRRRGLFVDLAHLLALALFVPHLSVSRMLRPHNRRPRMRLTKRRPQFVWLGLLALVAQLVSSFGHVHAGRAGYATAVLACRTFFPPPAG